MFASRISWYLIESIIPYTSEMFPMPLIVQQAQNMIDPLLCLTAEQEGVFFMTFCAFFLQKTFANCGQKIIFWLHQSTALVSKMPMDYLHVVLHTSNIHFCEGVTDKVRSDDSSMQVMFCKQCCTVQWCSTTPVSAKSSCRIFVSCEGFSFPFLSAYGQF